MDINVPGFLLCGAWHYTLPPISSISIPSLVHLPGWTLCRHSRQLTPLLTSSPSAHSLLAVWDILYVRHSLTNHAIGPAVYLPTFSPLLCLSSSYPLNLLEEEEGGRRGRKRLGSPSLTHCLRAGTANLPPSPSSRPTLHAANTVTNNAATTYMLC